MADSVTVMVGEGYGVDLTVRGGPRRLGVTRPHSRPRRAREMRGRPTTRVPRTLTGGGVRPERNGGCGLEERPVRVRARRRGGFGGGVGGDNKPAATTTTFATSRPATASTAPPETTAPTGGEYIVWSGDTLSGSPRSSDVTVAALVEANAIADPDKIKEGQRLKIPAPTPATAAGATTIAPVAGATTVPPATTAVAAPTTAAP